MTELHHRTSRFHDITVNDEDGVTVLRFNGRRQSSLDAATGIDAVQPYLDYLHATLAVTPEARRALVIGLGGGVFPKRMWHDYPEVAVDVVELDPDVIEIAHEYFGLPLDDLRLRVFAGDGREFLERSREVYDIIVVDAYFEASMPYEFVTREFMSAVASHLSSDGVVAYNMVVVPSGRGSMPFRRFMKTIAEGIGRTFVFTVGVSAGGRRENTVVLATRSELTAEELLARIRGRVGGRVTVAGFEGFADRLVEDGVHTRGVRPLADSEAPSGGFFVT